jgi:hypothetical protein
MSDALKPTIRIVTAPNPVKQLATALDRARVRAVVDQALADAKDANLFRRTEDDDTQ